MTRLGNRGTTSVEFALISTLFFIVLFGVVEFGRALFIWNTLAEATRRGARIAAVCPASDAAIAQVANFTAGGTTPLVPNLTAGNIDISYPAAGIVRVAITGYNHTLLIPIAGVTIAAPPFATTLPTESMGNLPAGGAGVAGGGTGCPVP